MSEFVPSDDAGEVVLDRGTHPVVRVDAERARRISPPGALLGAIRIADGFDSPLPEFASYLDDRE